jgi:hypothetical protein
MQYQPCNTMAISSNELWQSYIKLENFQAKCKFCDFQDYYINTTNFSQHVKEKHEEVFSYEEKCVGWPWIYFKYHAEYTLQCLICQIFLPSHLKYLVLYLHYSHSPNTLDYYYYYSWVWKYCKKSDFEVRYSLCITEI